MFNFFKRKHRCKFETPIISEYWSFNTRNIIYECNCGKRHAEKVWLPFNQPFPIPTTSLISHAEFEKILNGADYERLGNTQIVYVK